MIGEGIFWGCLFWKIVKYVSKVPININVVSNWKLSLDGHKWYKDEKIPSSNNDNPRHIYKELSVWIPYPLSILSFFTTYII